MILGQPHEQLAQRRRGPPAQLQRIGNLEHPALGVGHRAHPPQHGKQARQRQHVARQKRRHLLVGEAPQVAGQHVDQAVERLVRHRLVLVAAARERHGVGVPPAHLEQEAVDQRRLAEPRGAVDPDHRRLTAGQAVEGPPQAAQVPLAAHEDDRAPGLGAAAVRFVGLDAEACEHLVPLRAQLGFAAQQVLAQLVQIARDPRHQLPRRPRLAALLVEHHLDELSGEGRGPGQRLVDHRADAVPVGGLGEVAARALLGGHVGGRAEDVLGEALVGLLLGGLGDQAEIEEHHRPGAVTSTFDGLRSRCRRPEAWSARSPRASCRAAGRSRASTASAPRSSARGSRT